MNFFLSMNYSKPLRENFVPGPLYINCITGKAWEQLIYVWRAGQT